MMNEPKVLSYGKPSGWPKEVFIYTDGASRGNPGASAFGLTVLSTDGKRIFEYAQFLGPATNNSAEYYGIQKALEFSAENKIETLFLKTDSELIVKQLKGLYKIKSPHLKKFYLRSKELIKQISKVEITHVKREKNKRADELANLALDSFGDL